MKKVIAMIGSLRKMSTNRAVFNAYQQAAVDAFELKEGDYRDFPIYDQDIEEQAIPETVIRLADEIRLADGIIFFSPEYNYSIPGCLKNAIDWLSRVTDQPFNNKKCAIIGSSVSGLGTARMQYHLRQVCVYFNLHILNKPEVMIGGAWDKVQDGKLIDQSTIDFLGKHVASFKEYLG